MFHQRIDTGVVEMVVICGKCHLQNEIVDSSKARENKCKNCSAKLVMPAAGEQYYFDEVVSSKPIWYVKVGSQVSGPVSWKSVEFLVESGKLTSEDTIWSEDDRQPRKISEIHSIKEKLDVYFESVNEDVYTREQKIVNKRLQWMQWWFLDEMGEHGPFSHESFTNLIKSQRIGKDSYVRFEGLKRWIPLSEGIDILAGRKRVESILEGKSLKLDLSEIGTGLFYRNEEGSRGPLCLEDFMEILKTEEYQPEDEVWFDSESGWVLIDDWLSQIDPDHMIHKIIKEKSIYAQGSDHENEGPAESQCPHCHEITTIERSLLNHWRLCKNCHEPYRIKEYIEKRRKRGTHVAASEVLGIFAFPFKIFDIFHYYLEGISRHSADLLLKNGILFILIGLYCIYHFWFSDPTKMDSPDRVFEEMEILGAGMISIFIGLILWTAPKS